MKLSRNIWKKKSNQYTDMKQKDQKKKHKQMKIYRKKNYTFDIHEKYLVGLLSDGQPPPTRQELHLRVSSDNSGAPHRPWDGSLVNTTPSLILLLAAAVAVAGSGEPSSAGALSPDPTPNPLVSVDDPAVGHSLPGPLGIGDGEDEEDRVNELGRLVPHLIKDDAFNSIASLAPGFLEGGHALLHESSWVVSIGFVVLRLWIRRSCYFSLVMGFDIV